MPYEVNRALGELKTNDVYPEKADGIPYSRPVVRGDGRAAMDVGLRLNGQGSRVDAIVIEHLALGESELRDLVEDLTRERHGYRELLSLALTKLHEANARDRVHREQMARLVDELSDLTGRHDDRRGPH